MKFALVNPNWNFDGSIYFGCRDAHLPLEFGYSEALLRAAGHDVLTIDGLLYDLSLDDIAASLKNFAPDYTVATTAPSYLFWRCAPPELTCPQVVIEAVREHAGKVILVGPHSSTTPKAACDKTGADIVVLGECEEVLVQIASQPLSSLESVGYYARGKFVCGGVRHSTNMAALPALHWSSEDLRRHQHHHHRFDIKAEGWGAEMETSRGCPYACSFCAKNNFRNKYRKRPLAIILQELDGLIEAGAKYVYFIDEIFLPNRELLEAVKERDIQFGVQTRIDLWDFEMLQLLGEAGCVSIEAGVESITEEGRSELNKNCKMTTDDMSERLVHARKFVAFVQGNLIQAGTDDAEAVEEWRAGLLEGGVWANKPVPLFPYPGSPDYTKRWGMTDDAAWERAHEHYLKLYDDFSDVQDSRPLELLDLELPAPEREKPFRVLMTCDTVGGVWVYTMDLCRALSTRPVEITLAVLGPAMSDNQRREVSQIPMVQVYEHGGKLEWMEDPWDDVADAGRWLADLAREFVPDVVHLNGYTHAAEQQWPCPVVVVAHSCMFSWWKAVKGAAPPAAYNQYRKVVTAALVDASVVVAPTRAVLADLKNFYSLQGDCRVIYNGRNLTCIPPGPRENFIFSAGRIWDEAKNFSLLNEVAPQLDWPIIVAGDAQIFHSSNQYNNLTLVGQLTQDEMQMYSRSASIFVSPARYEPFGLCILEAALSGCPLVLSDLDSLREIWQDNAIYVDSDNPAELIKTLNSLTQDEVLRQTYSARALSHARRFTATRMAAEYWRLYDEMVQRPVSSRDDLPSGSRPVYALDQPKVARPQVAVMTAGSSSPSVPGV